MKAKPTLDRLKKSTKDKIWEVNDALDAQVKAQFVQKVAEDEKVSYGEAVAMCTSEGGVPKYSLGYKMASPSVMMWIRTKKGAEGFKKWLTPEELKIYEEEVMPMNIKGMMKAEFRRQKKEPPEGDA